MTICCLLAASVLLVSEGVAEIEGWPADQARAQLALEQALNQVPTRALLSQTHAMLCDQPHPPGSAGDRRVIARLEQALSDLGLEVERHELSLYAPRLVAAEVEVLSGGVRIRLRLREEALAEDPYSASPGIDSGWNAYSGSGDVTAPVVYANYATAEDFDALRRLGVEVVGRIVIARSGRIFRGHKARLAEQAGAAGLLLYTDPDDSGYRQGIPYPEGGWANGSSVQRGSILTLPYPGDPLTPFEEAGPAARRLDPATVPLARIPVQSLGWDAAAEILGRMRGAAVPQGWQGGLPFAYRLTGGPEIAVRLHVEQELGQVSTANVVASLRGSRFPEQKVIIGCHHDAWTFGAGDPNAGSIVLLAMAQSFAVAARRGSRPARTLVFANWAAEELATTGSVEWCEGKREDLAAHAVAYVNLDMAAMGPNFSASASPLLETVTANAARAVPQAGDSSGASAWAAWVKESGETPRFGDLGGGSDHVGFSCHLGIPSCGLGAWGSSGVSYHSAYDNLAWYRKVVGDDYEPALMLSRIGNVLAARLANSPLLPFDLAGYSEDVPRHLATIGERGKELGRELDLTPLLRRVEAHGTQARAIADRLSTAATSLDPDALARVNRSLMALERAWLDADGLPGRPWYRNLYEASDPGSGYSAWMLPLLRQAVEEGDDAAIAAAVAAYLGVFDRLSSQLDAIERELDSGRPE